MKTWELTVIPEDGPLQALVNGFREGLKGLQSARWRLIPVPKGRGKERKHHGWKGAVSAVGELNLAQFPKRHGECLARKCLEKDDCVWDNSPVLNVNWEERERMRKTVCVNLMLPMGDEKRILS